MLEKPLGFTIGSGAPAKQSPFLTNMKIKNYLDFPVGKTLLYKSLPMFLAIFANIAYGLVDTFFIGRLGTHELAAMSFAFPITMIVINLMMGIATAINSLTSRLIGGNRHEEAKETASQGLLFTLFASLMLTLFGHLTIKPLFQVLGVAPSILGHVRDYMTVWYSGMFFMGLGTVSGAIFRARGSVLYPSLVLFFGAILNGLLDPLLIFGWGPIPAMGMKGAALTTVLGHALSFCLLFSKLIKEQVFSLASFYRFPRFDIHKKIAVIGFPTAIANSFAPISTAFTNWLLVGYGNAAVAANSIATRIEIVPFIAIFALSSVLAPFVGQNWGASNIGRIREGLKKSFIFSYLLGAISAILLTYVRHSIGFLFDDNPHVAIVTSVYFSVVPISYGILGTVFLSTYSMNAIGKPFLGNLLSASRLVLFYLPLALILNQYFTISGVFFARAIANIVIGALCTLLIYRTFFNKAPGSLTEHLLKNRKEQR